MIESSLQAGSQVVVVREHLPHLLKALLAKGYTVVGPTVRDGAIVYDELTSDAELPVGWTDEQDGGTYRIKKRADAAIFGYTVGPQAWKKFLHPALMRLWHVNRNGGGFQVVVEDEQPTRYAFLGVRSCDLHAIAVQDKVLLGGKFIDPAYQSRRRDAFIVAVSCGEAGGTCFCASMNTGPRASVGFDLALTEVQDADGHYFVVDVGTELGAEMLREIPHPTANADHLQIVDKIMARATDRMGRVLDTTDIKSLLYRNSEHPQWESVATRCLSCANCTMVCPTCFCITVEDATDVRGDHAERWRKWDSCFNVDFSYIHGGSVRTSVKARYRQWLTHKLAAWIDQFGTSGCVGCGRCITWCPVAIDITEEVRAIRETQVTPKAAISIPRS